MSLTSTRLTAPALLGIRPGTGLASSGEPGRQDRLYAVKARIHRQLLENLDFGQFDSLDPARKAVEIRQVLNHLLEEETEPLNLTEKARLVDELEFEILGLGPLEPLMQDPTISDILANRYDQVYIERRGRLDSPTCGSRTMSIS